MFVRFVKDYKKFKKDTIIKCNTLYAKYLLNNGIASKAGKCYKIKDLYIAELVKPNQRLFGAYVNDYEPLGYSIFFYKDNSSLLDDGLERGIYINVVTGKEYFPSNHKDRKHFSRDMKIVRKESAMHYSSLFYADLHAKGLTEENYVEASDVIYNEYVVRAKMQKVNKSQNNDGPDYCF